MEIQHVQTKIYVVKGQNVMLDRDLAELYGMETKRLKEAVKRNIKRFPEDFMFEITKKEAESLRSQIATSLILPKHSKIKGFENIDLSR